MELSTFFLVLLITIVGATLQGSVGFGLGFVAVPLLAFIDQRFLPGPLLLAAFFLTVFLAYREHQAIEFKGIKWAIGGRLLGSSLGAQLLVVIPQSHLSIVFASMVMIGVVLSFSGLRLKLTNKNLFSAGTLSGLMSTTSAIGGPPMALLYQYLEGPSLRGTLSGIFMIGAVISITMLVIINRFGLMELKLTLFLLPGIFTGFFLSRLTARQLDKGFLRQTILIFSFLSGSILMLETLCG
jgi:uncharacterized membrane protein YfcA